MRKRFYIGLIVLAVLLLALGRLVVRPPAVLARGRAMAPGGVEPPHANSKPDGQNSDLQGENWCK
jgi:hypothetical protein